MSGILRRGQSAYVADFETAATPELLLENPVWCWAVASVETGHCEVKGTKIDAFMDWAVRQDKADIYFHNLKFDGEFITYWLLTHDYTHEPNETFNRKCPPGTFTTVISGLGQWYAVAVRTDAGVVTFKDSLKRIPLRVEAIPKAYGLDSAKGSIDHKVLRPAGYVPTAIEWDYVVHDVEIVAQALAKQDELGMTRCTVGSNALAHFKEGITGEGTYWEKRKRWARVFPELKAEDDAFCRAAYLGGWTYANPAFSGEMHGAGCVYDVNSMYPGVMLRYPFPWGHPVAKGAGMVPKHYQRAGYVFFQRATFTAKLRSGCPPILRVRDSPRFHMNRYITDTAVSTFTGEPCNPAITATLTNVDWDMLLDYYDVEVLKYDSYMVFRAKTGLFDDYINEWAEAKISAGKSGNIGLRTISKLYLNNLYGKFGTSPYRAEKAPYFDPEAGKVRYRISPAEAPQGGYVPVAALCTAYARREVTQAAKRNWSRFLYADTDSVHLLGTEAPQGMELDEHRLGAWAHEADFTQGKYIGAKCYAEKIGGDWKITVAGMPDGCKESMLVEDDFHIGYVAQGKLIPRRYPGGVILQETTFEIKER